ncbi:MAG TPA: hypothetical protein VI011_06450 [Asanoa sp.]
MSHTFAIVMAMVALMCLPAIVAVIVFADDLAQRAIVAGRARRAARRQRRALSHLDRAIGPVRGLPVDNDPKRPTIEQIAADLDRLGRQRMDVAHRSAVWQTAVTKAYDERLRLACQCLGIEQHLAVLDGVDLEIERVRVEGEVQGAGLPLPTAGSERRREQR